MEQIINYFAETGFPITLTVLVGVVILAFLILLIYIPTLTKKIFPQFGYSNYSAYLPFQKVNNNNTISIEGGSSIKVYHLDGIQVSMQTDEERAKFLDLRAQLFNQIRDPGVIIRFYTTRDKIEQKTDYEFHQATLQKINDKWQGQGLKIFVNNYYVVLSVYGDNKNEKLEQYGNYIESILAAYKPKVLKNNTPFWGILLVSFGATFGIIKLVQYNKSKVLEVAMIQLPENV